MFNLGCDININIDKYTKCVSKVTKKWDNN